MKKDKAFDIVKQALLKSDPGLSEGEINMAADLQADFGFDSLDVVETCINIEDQLVKDLGFDRALKDLKRVTVKDLVEVVEKI